MAISEAQLTTWSHQGSTTQSAATYNAIKTALEDSRAPYASRSFEVYLQGSYGNDTNIYADSDVDVIICLSSVYYSDLSNLAPDDRKRYDANFSKAAYDVNTFKREVASWLTTQFGQNVKPGRKAIAVPPENGRRKADVLACAEHRRYYTYPASGSPDVRKGICFWTSDGEYIVNFPKQHSSNCTTKHQATHSRFKPSIRIIKNMRNAMVDKGFLTRGIAPSYFLEGMLSNVPNTSFASTHQDTFANYVNWLKACDSTKLTCANGLHWLLRDGSPTSWRKPHFDDFLASAIRFWNA
jgi:hypothetical protein